MLKICNSRCSFADVNQGAGQQMQHILEYMARPITYVNKLNFDKEMGA